MAKPGNPDNVTVPSEPFADPEGGKLPNPGTPQPLHPGNIPPNIDHRVAALEQKVALLEQVVGVPGAPGSTGE